MRRREKMSELVMRKFRSFRFRFTKKRLIEIACALILACIFGVAR